MSIEHFHSSLFRAQETQLLLPVSFIFSVSHSLSLSFRSLSTSWFLFVLLLNCMSYLHLPVVLRFSLSPCITLFLFISSSVSLHPSALRSKTALCYCKTMQGLALWGRVASGTSETMKHNPGSPVWVIDPWVWRLYKCGVVSDTTNTRILQLCKVITAAIVLAFLWQSTDKQ